MRHSISMILLSAGIVLSLAGCQKDHAKTSELSGKAVRFAVSSKSAATRTAFSGEGTVAGTDEFGRNILSWERIDWKVGDQVMIASDEAIVYETPSVRNAVYTVESFTATDENKVSEARVEEMDSEDELFFTSADSYTFWGVYPAAVGDGATLETGKVNYALSASQAPAGNPETITKDGKNLTVLQPDMTQAVLLAKAANVTTESVVLDFYPGFTTFEFTLLAKEDVEISLGKVVFSSSSDLAGNVAATINTGAGNNAYTYSSTGKEITFTFPANTTISKTEYLTFTFFALPQKVEGLTMAFYDPAGNLINKGSLKKGGADIEFAGSMKHCLRGVALKSGWEFSVLNFAFTTLWEDVSFDPVSSQAYPQSTQFQISGDVDNIYDDLGGEKRLRQCWVFNKADGVATVTFKVMLPKGGTWKVVPQAVNEGDLDAFIITPSTLTGSIGNDGTTRVTFTIKPAEGKYNPETGSPYIIFFKTYVTNANGTDEFSLDSETQLYDMRGYHYFILNTTNPEI